jgi:hypothetical protein
LLHPLRWRKNYPVHADSLLPQVNGFRIFDRNSPEEISVANDFFFLILFFHPT